MLVVLLNLKTFGTVAICGFRMLGAPLSVEIPGAALAAGCTVEKKISKRSTCSGGQIQVNVTVGASGVPPKLDVCGENKTGVGGLSPVNRAAPRRRMAPGRPCSSSNCAK